MKRTYVDILGEYYDNNDELHEDALKFGLQDGQLRKLYRVKQIEPKRKEYRH